VHTYKVILDPQPLGAVLLQEPLQQLPACVRHVGLQHRSLVQDAVVHLSRVTTVEGGLLKKTGDQTESTRLRRKVRQEGRIHASLTSP